MDNDNELSEILGVRDNLPHCETAFSTFWSPGASTRIGIKFAIPDDLWVDWRSVE
jgi:hypothetical protein